jgi:hypothetical protein
MKARSLVPLICRGKTEVAIYSGRASYAGTTSANCPGGIERLKFTEGMDCPMCPGSKLRREIVGFWD